MQEKSIQPVQDRAIRVFISSTFRDMKEEREELVKRVFPRLRKLCEGRGVTWGEVDLRWGITDEEKAEGKVLPICLAEIQGCRPYFIGMLGERYGWVPVEIPGELIEQEPWLAEHRERSVTELEILHGVLNDPVMADHTFFYLRNPAYVDQLADDKRVDCRECPTPEEIKRFGEVEAERRAGERSKKLTTLKQRIRASGLPLREDYMNPQELGELVLRDLTDVINRLFPEGAEPDPLDREAAEHEAFAQSRFKVYIGRQKYFDRLDEHARGGGQPLVVLGESGSGKSALLANWGVKYREKHPDELFIMHFIGATPYSADWAAMLRRIMGEFKRRFDIKEDIPTEPDKLRRAFANWLHMAAAKGRVVLILDALNQLEDRDNAPDLVWLPPFIPENIRLILSTLPGRPLDDLKKREWPTMEVKPLYKKERRELIREYLAQYSKSLSGKRIDRIVDAKQTRNPLYLRALLEELRVFGEHELLDERIDHYLAAQTVPALYEKILERYEQDYERDRQGLVRDAMTLIWAARRGLSEAELLDLLGENGEPLPQAFWAPFYLAAEHSLVSRSGLIGFSHDYLRHAAEDRYLPIENKQTAAHLRLADYFAAHELNPRQVDELPWQRAEAKSWQQLYDLLANLEFFSAAWQEDEFEVKRYWVKIEGSSSLQKLDAYQTVLKEPEGVSDNDTLMHLPKLLSDMGHPLEALSLQEFLAEKYRQDGNYWNLAKSLRGQAGILFTRGDPDGAMDLLKENERICRELGDPVGLNKALGNQAIILRRRGDLDDAMELLKEVERICRELGDPASLDVSLINQALILSNRGDLDGAMALYKEDERICRELGDPASLSGSLNNQAFILNARGDLDGAMELLRDQERICRELGDPAGLQISLGNQAIVLRMRGDLDSAMALLKEKERICRELGDPAGLQVSLGNQGVILWNRGDLDGAMELYKEQERICRELGDPARLQISLGNQAIVLRMRGDLDSAMALLKEKERICRQLGDPRDLAHSLAGQAEVLAAKGNLNKALPLAEEACELVKEHGDAQLAEEVNTILAEIYIKLGDPGKAIELLKEQEHTYRKAGNLEILMRYLACYAKAFLAMGQAKEALPLAEEAYELATKHGYALQAKEIKPVLDEIRSQLA